MPLLTPTLLLYPGLGLAGEYQKVIPQAEFPLDRTCDKTACTSPTLATLSCHRSSVPEIPPSRFKYIMAADAPNRCPVARSFLDGHKNGCVQQTARSHMKFPFAATNLWHASKVYFEMVASSRQLRSSSNNTRGNISLSNRGTALLYPPSNMANTALSGVGHATFKPHIST